MNSEFFPKSQKVLGVTFKRTRIKLGLVEYTGHFAGYTILISGFPDVSGHRFMVELVTPVLNVVVKVSTYECAMEEAVSMALLRIQELRAKNGLPKKSLPSIKKEEPKRGVSK